jgi:hypothetical protein
LLATDAASCDSKGSEFGRLQSQFRLTNGLLPLQLCRFVPCRSSARTIEVTDEEQETSGEESPTFSNVAKPKTQSCAFEILSFCIAQPDHLIELPGTPPPAALC